MFDSYAKVGARVSQSYQSSPRSSCNSKPLVPSLEFLLDYGFHSRFVNMQTFVMATLVIEVHCNLEKEQMQLH